MSPHSLRRYRAERLLRQEFQTLRGRVIASVRARLRAAGVGLHDSDIESCYAQAWHGLYAAVLDGQQITNPAAWLALVTFRRAIEEHRARARAHACPSACDGGRGREEDLGALARQAGSRCANRDLAADLDDRIKLRAFFEALRVRLSDRELQAAALCYLHGLSRSDAAARMGVSEARMRKLMEGSGAGRPGVAGKVAALAQTIAEGGWCEEQGSLMRGFAYGILDPEGERYELALLHSSACPACRAYVLSLRRLASLLPPLPSLLHSVLGAAPGASGAGAVSGLGIGAHAGAALGRGAAAGTTTAAGTRAAAQASSLGGALPASSAAGAGAAGGGWLLAGGSAGGKLAVACMLALGLGAGCVALSAHPGDSQPQLNRRDRAHADVVRTPSSLDSQAGAAGTQARLDSATPWGGLTHAGAARARSSPRLSAARQASREFGPEQALAASAPPPPASATGSPTATAAVAHDGGRTRGGEFSLAPQASGGALGASPQSGGTRSTAASAAQREFAPG